MTRESRVSRESLESLTVALPDDPKLRAAVLAKRDEYAERLAVIEEEEKFTHPELAILRGIAQDNTSCFNLRARIMMINDLERSKEVQLGDFAQRFTASEPGIGQTSRENGPFYEELLSEAMEQGLIVQHYCTENVNSLSGGTGLSIPESTE